jgi:hypothetical protein
MTLGVDVPWIQVRHYHLRDALDPTFAQALVPIKLVIVPNAFALDDSALARLAQFLRNRTAVFYYAPGLLLPASTGKSSPRQRQMEFHSERMSKLVGCPLVRGAGNRSLTSKFAPTAPAPVRQQGPQPFTCPDLSPLANRTYAPTFLYNPGPQHGPSSVLDPWFTLPRGGGDTASQCTVLAHYHAGAVADKVPLAASTCSADHTGTRIWTSGPFPSEALQLIAKNAGVHLFLPGSTRPTDDAVEAAGAGLMLHGGSGASAMQRRVVVLPPRKGGWNVTDESGHVVLPSSPGSSSFEFALDKGEVALWTLS